MKAPKRVIAATRRRLNRVLEGAGNSGTRSSKIERSLRTSSLYPTLIPVLVTGI